MYKLKVSVTSMLGKCPNHEIGDYFIIENDVLFVPDGEKVCIWSLSTLLPFLSGIQRKHDEESDWLSDTKYIECPDPEVKLIWEIEKIDV